MNLPRRCALRAAAALCLAVTAACDDLPTTPQVWTREAAGRTWVAVSEPQGLPDARAWMPWATPAAADSARGLLTAAVRERRAGRLDEAMRAEEAAGELTASALQRSPDAAAALGALAALESWAERASVPAAEGRFPELARDVGLVRQLAAASHAALAAGDTAGAVARMTRGAGLARRWTPTAVATRALARADSIIAADPDPSPELQRARRLLRSARQGVATGDHARALQRAMYALQLMESSGR